MFLYEDCDNYLLDNIARDVLVRAMEIGKNLLQDTDNRHVQWKTNGNQLRVFIFPINDIVKLLSSYVHWNMNEVEQNLD